MRTATVNGYEECPFCHGYGKVWMLVERTRRLDKCFLCNGLGRILVLDKDDLAG